MVYGLDDDWPKYDYIIVANMYSDEIYRICIARGIDIDKTIFLRGVKKDWEKITPRFCMKF